MQESLDAANSRWARLSLLQQAYPEFVPFLQDGMKELGFRTSEIQEDIALWLQHGPAMLMVMAQRGEAKTTITALYAIWLLIHDPRLRILIVSAGEDLASEISTLIVKLIAQWEILEALRPGPGDRTSVEHYDVHSTLKGVDKSPSIACLGIKSNLPGRRADILIADDVESPKNALTATNRAELEHLTKEFSSIVVDRKDMETQEVTHQGRIIWLGTPQSADSIYNGLPARGVHVRIWPGRMPNEEQVRHYGEALAPIILRKLAAGAKTTGFGLTGEAGEPTDPLLRNEQTLLFKEADQGPAHFQLQFMLLTAMTDALRHPLKTEHMIVMPMQGKRQPMRVVPGFGKRQSVTVNGRKFSYSVPHETSTETAELQSTCLYIDPAGGGINGDENAYAFGGALNSSIRVLEWGGLKGGHNEDDLKAIAALVIRLRPTIVKVEKNFGYGLFMTALRPVVTAAIDAHNKGIQDGTILGEWVPYPAFEEDMVHGQKELRIINILEPVLGRGALVFNESIILTEQQSVMRYEPRVRDTYSGLFQLAKITRDKQSLIHDDRIDALAGLVHHYGATLAIDQIKAVQASQKREFERMMKNPLGLPASALKPTTTQNSLQKRIRKL